MALSSPSGVRSGSAKVGQKRGGEQKRIPVDQQLAWGVVAAFRLHPGSLRTARPRRVGVDLQISSSPATEPLFFRSPHRDLGNTHTHTHTHTVLSEGQRGVHLGCTATSQTGCGLVPTQMGSWLRREWGAGKLCQKKTEGKKEKCCDKPGGGGKDLRGCVFARTLRTLRCCREGCLKTSLCW